MTPFIRGTGRPGSSSPAVTGSVATTTTGPSTSTCGTREPSRTVPAGSRSASCCGIAPMPALGTHWLPRTKERHTRSKKRLEVSSRSSSSTPDRKGRKKRSTTVSEKPRSCRASRGRRLRRVEQPGAGARRGARRAQRRCAPCPGACRSARRRCWAPSRALAAGRRRGAGGRRPAPARPARSAAGPARRGRGPAGPRGSRCCAPGSRGRAASRRRRRCGPGRRRRRPPRARSTSTAGRAERRAHASPASPAPTTTTSATRPTLGVDDWDARPVGRTCSCCRRVRSGCLPGYDVAERCWRRRRPGRSGARRERRPGSPWRSSGCGRRPAAVAALHREAAVLRRLGTPVRRAPAGGVAEGDVLVLDPAAGRRRWRRCSRRRGRLDAGRGRDGGRAGRRSAGGGARRRAGARDVPGQRAVHRRRDAAAQRPRAWPACCGRAYGTAEYRRPGRGRRAARRPGCRRGRWPRSPPRCSRPARAGRAARAAAADVPPALAGRARAGARGPRRRAPTLAARLARGAGRRPAAGRRPRGAGPGTAAAARGRATRWPRRRAGARRPRRCAGSAAAGWRPGRAAARGRRWCWCWRWCSGGRRAVAGRPADRPAAAAVAPVRLRRRSC